ncbi:hypothetical protein [Calothrix sp. UHCC 0171]|uniref:hypothetical protein n=1 Tax=Calothrix sp. UHCC 0171 TaxID=3110245 RepID=UPI002B21A06D|nr:hypothetical protein [Calothrix sp. UHCC 0171]MEA5573729.1 hypothetical protein [Calothrix sp. UHCC 0171]
MSQNPLMHSGSQFSRTPNLKPALAAALASLEVQLDRELARYRRMRGTSRTSNQAQSVNSHSSQLQYATSAVTSSKDEIAEGTSQSLVGSELENPPTPTPPIYSSVPLTYVPEIPTPPPPPPMPKVAENGVNTGLPTTSDTPSSSSSIIPSHIASADKPKTEQNHTEIQVPPTSQPDDYLESSEALLRSLTEDTSKDEKRSKTNNDSLLSPLGIGSILLLLAASLILAYAILNRSLPFGLNGGLGKGNNTTTSENPLTTENSGQTPAEIKALPKYPNLARDEFPEVNNPNDVVGLKPKSTSIPTTPENPPAIPNQIPQNQIPTEQPPQQPTPIAPTTAVSPSPTQVEEISIDEAKPSADGFYHIVTENNNPNALANARKVVKDAYLSSDKKLVLLGAMKDKQGAQRLLDEMKAKGINARIRQP